MQKAHLAVQAKCQKHEEEEERPEGRQRQHGHGLWVDYKGQARAWARAREVSSLGHAVTPYTHTIHIPLRRHTQGQAPNIHF